MHGASAVDAASSGVTIDLSAQTPQCTIRGQRKMPRPIHRLSSASRFCT
eukprot:COSAG01_NODE_53993_length_335_cov_0.860169_1_plen_48_part_10